MKRKVLGFSLLANISLLSLGVVGLSACGGKDNQVSAPYLSLGASQLTMNVGETKAISYSVSKSYGGVAPRWFSSNESVAFFRDNSKGYVTAVGPGEATITVAVGGSYADCKVIVTGSGGTGGGGGGEQETKYLVVSPTSVSLAVGGTKQLTVNKAPADTVVTFTSGDQAIATVSDSGLITAVGQGSTSVTASGSNGKIAVVSVNVTEAGGGGDQPQPGEYSYGININKGYSASRTIVIGTPDAQSEFIQGLLADFNRITGSNITFQFKQFEEGTGVGNGAAASSFPDIFPYASDQIIDMKNGGFLSPLRKTYTDWIGQTSGVEAKNASRLGTSYYGFPIAADNGVVMYYDANRVSASEIDTLPKLFAKADELGLEVNMKYAEGFYAAGLLSTYAGDDEYYTITATATGYKSAGHFNCQGGIDGAKLSNDIFMQDCISPGVEAPGGDSLATITNTSYIKSFKSVMATKGAQYAVAPVPFVDEAKTTRMGNYLGYKFMGVNGSITDSSLIELCSDIAQFMTSEYAQAKRFNDLRVQPTMTSLQEMCSVEPHIAALQTIRNEGSYIPLTSVGSELWSACATAVTKFTTVGFAPTDANITPILEELDSTLTVNK